MNVAYLIVTGTTSAPLGIDIARGLVTRFADVITIPTAHAARVVATRDLSVIPGNRVVESYFDEAILPRPPDGLVLVAPCSFNSLNKLAQGVADSLALSVTAEAIGRGTPVIVAVSVNPPLFRHPRTAQSVATLRSWGISVIEPQDTGEGFRLAPVETILAEVDRRNA